MIGFDGDNKADTLWNATPPFERPTQFYSQLIYKNATSTFNNLYGGYFRVGKNSKTVSARYKIYREGGANDSYSFKGRKIN